MNIKLIKDILMSSYEYWIVAKKTYYRENFETKEGEHQIILIAIPTDEIKIGLEYKDIKLEQFEKLYESYIEKNIFINVDIPPFQNGIRLRDFYYGFPIKENVKEFMIKALELKSNSIYDYEKILVK